MKLETTKCNLTTRHYFVNAKKASILRFKILILKWDIILLTLWRPSTLHTIRAWTAIQFNLNTDIFILSSSYPHDLISMITINDIHWMWCVFLSYVSLGFQIDLCLRILVMVSNKCIYVIMVTSWVSCTTMATLQNLAFFLLQMFVLTLSWTFCQM